MGNVIVRKSKIQGKGVYASKNIKKGQIVIGWRPKRTVSKKQMKHLSKSEQNHVSFIGKGKYVLMGVPERYVNHSCDPNTRIKHMKDIALKNIKKGEEITSDYSIGDVDKWKMKCKCGSKKCRGIVYGGGYKK